jgi:large subunit ribosomal protein L15
MKGKNMGSHGRGARKKGKGNGHRGGKGMAGTGKRADHKKTLMTKLYGHGYFGKQGITSKGTRRDIRKRISLRTITGNLQSYGQQKGKEWTISLKEYKVLGDGEVSVPLMIECESASASAIEKVKKAGGKIILPNKKEEKQKPNKGSETLEDTE